MSEEDWKKVDELFDANDNVISIIPHQDHDEVLIIVEDITNHAIPDRIGRLKIVVEEGHDSTY